MRDGIVDGTAPERHSGDDAVDDFLILGKEIQGQGSRSVANPLNGFSDLLIGEDGQDRTEDFLFHHFAAFVDFIHQGWTDKQGSSSVSPP